MVVGHCDGAVFVFGGQRGGEAKSDSSKRLLDFVCAVSFKLFYHHSAGVKDGGRPHSPTRWCRCQSEGLGFRVQGFPIVQMPICALKSLTGSQLVLHSQQQVDEGSWVLLIDPLHRFWNPMHDSVHCDICPCRTQYSWLVGWLVAIAQNPQSAAPQ